MRTARLALSRLFPFLRGQPPLDREEAHSVLVVGSGSRQNLARALEMTRLRFPDASITLAVERASEDAWRAVDGVVFYDGLLRFGALHRAVGRHSVKLVLFTGEGQTGLKLLAFTLPARRMLVFTEGGGVFAWSFDERLAIWNHLRWRLGSGQPLVVLLRRAGGAIVRPLLTVVAFVLLLLWHVGLFIRRMGRQWLNR